ncbi:energy-coupling factor ABC transporter permease [Haloquadratum walsbyi]|jgi:cobalt/nickel transport system permease protein|uniref:ABC-type transport system permease protein (Probable substrate cobalt/nickel/biotin) n=1 Tax=Haloquadratum walsbyi (strain DSM 16854 / JCM 12705 / C23) TaxID=768065 RepID=G0LIK5_HALWC|nr:energy-coupling factor ABC transporter permease [Haloquadratum walsbyi]CCC40257.1 ABC-type transport system permease protein (probable substrate cobalt/nickel/biotin) [Haloquadratum walsbyi C23]
MAHIHLGEGTFPVWALILWTTIGVVLISAIVYRIRKGSIKTHQIALAGIGAAASFAVFQLNIPVWGGIHMNLTGLVGIIAGPLLGALIALVVNIFSAALGHGAVGLLGANTLVNASEAIVAYYAFKTLMRMDWDVFPASASAATLGLSAGAFLMGAIIIISGVNGSALPRGDLTIAVAGLVGLNLGVAVIEGILTGFIIQFLASVRPDLVDLADRDTQEEPTGVTA